MTHAKAALPRLVRQAEGGEIVAITRRGETVAYLVSCRRLEGLFETMELLANPRARQAIADHRAGRTKLHALAAIDCSG